MHVWNLGVRLAILTAAVFAIMLAFGSVGQGPQHQVEAAGTMQNSVVCADVHFNEGLLGDFGPTSLTFGDPPPPSGVPGGSLLLGKSVTRQDAVAGVIVDNTQVLYLGADIDGFEPVETGPGSIIDILGFGDLVPDGPPTNELCQTKADGANTRAEPVDQLKVKAATESQFRPSDATIFSVSKGTGPGGGDVFSTLSCIFTAANGWLRQETHTNILATGPKASNNGQAALFLDANSPPDASEVDTNGNGVPDYTTDPASCTGGTPFTSYTVSVNREATTDDPTNVKDNVILDPSGDQTGSPPIPLPQPPDTADTLADDWDGDGCTDWDELSPTLKAGADPFSPVDCDQDINGIWNLLASVDKASKVANPNGEEDGAGPGSCTDTIDNGPDGATDLDDADCHMILGGTNYSCIARIGEPSAGVLDANLACYQDSLSLSGDSAVPSRSDGISGAPPPPPYTTGVPTKAAGTIVGKVIHLQACFEELGPPLGPNVLWDVNMVISANGQMKGTVDIYQQVNNDDCDALAFPAPKSTGGTSGEILLPGVTITGAEQVIGFDHDDDGCTDFQELGHDQIPATTAKCGDDPYNPYDSGLLYDPANSEDGAGANTCGDNQDNGDADGKDAADSDCFRDIGVSGSYTVIARVEQTGAAHPTAGWIPGAYFNCVSEIAHNTGDNSVAATIYCYTDSVIVTPGTDTVPGTADDDMVAISVNSQDSLVAACGAVTVGGALDLTKCGDGNPGPNPPGPAGAGNKSWGDVDDPHAVLTGIYDKGTNEFVLEGCFASVENPTQGPNIYVKAVLPAHAGNGTATIWTQRDDCTDPGVAPATFTNVAMLTARQSDDTFSFDTDQDGCTDAQELQSGFQAERNGGLRDPFNYWDFRDVPAGGALTRDKAVVIQDISAVVSRFGKVGTPTDDPVHLKNTAGTYHTAYDTSGGILGSAGNWNLRGPDGAIVIQDIQATVAQFGHNCL